MPTPLVASACGMKARIQKRINTLPPVSVSEHSPATNSPFEIISLYPNPARESSTLRVHVNQSAPLELRVIDMLGAEIRHIDLGMQGEGEFEVPILLNDLSVGSYIVELRSDSLSRNLQIKIQ